MCGIAGYVRTRSAGKQDLWPKWLGTVGSTLAHRGPDDCGSIIGEDFGFAFTRLSLIDLDGGGQPLSNEDGTVRLVCNGEIFNHRVLRRELTERGHVFRTESDVEVIIHLYEELGMGLLDRLDGQFAFALHDACTGTTYLARDHFGICPLFWSALDGGVAFASEVPSILAHDSCAAQVDLVGLDQVMILPGQVSPQTMFFGVQSIPPGHYIKIESCLVSIREYWDLQYPVDREGYLSLDFEEMAEALLAILASAVEARMCADVPVGAYLSGGLDSSLIGALAVATSGRRLPLTFSVGYAEASYDESSFSDTVAKLVSEQHVCSLVGLNDIASGLADAVVRSATALRESYNVASLVLSRSVRNNGGKAVLGGEGADELFAGYPGYRFDRLRDQGLLAGAKPTVSERTQRARAWGDESLRYEHDLIQARAWADALYAPEVVAALGDGCLRGPLVDHKKLKGRHRVHQRSYLDVKLRLGDHLLGDHGDRMAMANGVEVRYPFLSRGVAELAVRMPPWMKLRAGEEKAIVRRAAQDLVPKAVLNREKFSWASHGSSSLIRGAGLPRPAREMVEYLLSAEKIRRDGLFDPAAVEVERERQHCDQLFSPNGEPDLLMVVLTTGILTDHYKTSNAQIG